MIAPSGGDILKAMTGQGEMTIREIGRRVDRDVKAVHGDVQALLVGGVLDRADSGRVIFPYDAVHVDFTLCKAAMSGEPQNALHRSFTGFLRPNYPNKINCY